MCLGGHSGNFCIPEVMWYQLALGDPIVALRATSCVSSLLKLALAVALTFEVLFGIGIVTWERKRPSLASLFPFISVWLGIQFRIMWRPWRRRLSAMLILLQISPNIMGKLLL